MIDTKKRITFDIETYPSAFIITGLVNGETWQEYVVCPSVEGFPSEVDCGVVRQWLSMLPLNGWVATYNGKNFDLRVLAWIANCGKHTLSTKEISEAAAQLISDLNAKQGNPKTSPCWSVKYGDIAKLRKNHFDVLKCYTGEHSLKWWELQRGWSVKESSVPFDQPTMNESELLECIRYCRHDVKCTDLLYMEKDCQELIEARQWVIDNSECEVLPDLPAAELAETYCYGDSDPGDEVGTAFDIIPWQEFNVPEDFLYQMQQIARHEITSFTWNGITYGAGGAHYAKKGRHKKKKIFDVASLYPHIIWFMLKLKTPSSLKRYVDCIHKRIENKHKKGTPEYNKSADKGLKVVLNSLSGKFGQPGSKAYAPEHRLAMCLIGQILITEAANYAVRGEWEELIEINTDSFAVGRDDIIARAREYCDSKPHKFTFEEDSFDDSYWKDVNNYFVYGQKDGRLSLKEAHGGVGTNLSTGKSETIVTESLAVNLREEESVSPYLCNVGGRPEDVMLTAENCVVKWVKSAASKSANIDGVPMDKKYYYFLWVTEDCPDCHKIQFNASKINPGGTISPRCGVYTFDGVEALKKYERWIDREQYVEDLKRELNVWGRSDMYTPVSGRSVPAACNSFHEIKQAANGFFSLPDDLF